MKKTKKGVRSFRRYILVGLCVLLFLLIGWVFIVIFKTPRYQKPDITSWNTGNIFFSVGDSWKSVVVRALTGARDLEMPDSTPSHCGIVLRENGKVWLVHESTDKGRLVKEDAMEYQRINGSYCIFARTVPCHIDTFQLKREIEYWLNSRKPFDYDFNHKDTTSLYCTEFVVVAMMRSGCNVFSDLRQNQYIYPNELQKKCKDSDKTQ